MSDPVYYKVLGVDGVCCHGGAGRWHTDGSWMPVVYGGLAPCVRGYHLCRDTDLVEWLGPVIWTAEGRGNSFVNPQYLIFQEARVLQPMERWNDALARSFAVECARRVEPLLKAALPEENRIGEALAMAQALAETSAKDFSQAHALAARIWTISRQVDGAVRDAAIAVYGALNWESGGLAAWAAAGSARTSAAAAASELSMAESKAQGVHPRDAERTAGQASAKAMNGERTWQTNRLFELLGEPLPQGVSFKT
ncbi:MAG: hypothetical protein HQL95_09285 [Magnetococcales bacterium]|nr:hypothetical protein [Magnetococcales bacterium]